MEAFGALASRGMRPCCGGVADALEAAAPSPKKAK